MEELDLDTNNLCTTEDAFEEFQSGAMYEEDEFITLSDIVSSPPTNQDVNEILHDDPCDEVVSLSIQEEKSVNNLPIKQNVVLDANSQIKEQSNKNNISIPKKRGRKKKGSFENSNVQQTQCQIDIKETAKPKRRSRKSLLTTDTSSDFQHVEECAIEEPKGAIHLTGKLIKPGNKAKRKPYNSFSPKEIKKHLKKQSKQAKAKQISKKLQTELINEDKSNQVSNTTDIEETNINTITTNIDIKKNKHKGSRKKHKISCRNPVSNKEDIQEKMTETKCVSTSNTENNKFENSVPMYDETNKNSEISDIPNFTNKVTSHKCVVSKSVKNYNSEEDIEDLPLSNLSRKTENGLNKNVDINTTIENENLTNLIINSKITSNVKTIVKKRGRPKKHSVNPPAELDIGIKKLISNTSDKNDDITDLSTPEKHNRFVNPETFSEPIISPTVEPQVLEPREKVNLSAESNFQSKRNSKKKIIPDFEYNIDSVVKNNIPEDSQQLNEDNENIDTEDSSRRPVRRRVLKNWNYDEGSDEDPYANVESSDDEPRRRKKGGRYYSDDDYFPGDKRQLTETESDIGLDEDILELNNRPQKKKRSRSNLIASNKSPRKKGRKSDAESICTTEITNTNTDSGDIDFEDCLDSSVTRGNEDQGTATKLKKNSESFGKTNEFENFIAKIVQGTDIKISKKSVDNKKTPLQIPVIEATEAKKSIDKSAQTVSVNTRATYVQTDTVYEIPMKEQVPLTGEQSEKACDFLTGIVQTTAELGQLMTQKSEDFITKKINTKYVTDTFKMDYCVKKSFLLFKLAKHNLVQMEEDLSKQYEEFLKENNLIQHRQEQKIIASTSKASDSDCEIVEETEINDVPPKAQKPAFNPKTVFLNKELSIKIAKKNSEEPTPKKNLNIKGRHSVWINDSVLVKKVKPNQSFLAQDSRNKKPPDTKVTLEMVNDFFKMYERQKALFVCAPYMKTQWFGKEGEYICNYFVDSTKDFPEKSVVMQNENVVPEVAFVQHDLNHDMSIPKPEDSSRSCPETLSLMCIKIVQNCLQTRNTDYVSNQSGIKPCEHIKTNSESRTNIVAEETDYLVSDINKNLICFKPNFTSSIYAQSLKTLCFKRVMELMNSAHYSDCKPKLTSERREDNVKACKTVFYENESNHIVKMKKNTREIKPLISLCVIAIQKTQRSHLNRKINNIKYVPKTLKSLSLSKVKTKGLEQKKYNVKTLLNLCIDATNSSLNGSINTNSTNLEQQFCKVKSLSLLSIDAINSSFEDSNTKNTRRKQKKYIVKTLLQFCIDATNSSSNESIITNSTNLEQQFCKVKSLTRLCIDAINSSFGDSNTDGNSKKQKKYNVITLLHLCTDATNRLSYENSIASKTDFEQTLCNVKSLVQLCKESTNNLINFNKVHKILKSEPLLKEKYPEVHSAMSLKSICRNKISELSIEWLRHQTMLHEITPQKAALNFTINNVNTVSDDVFLDGSSDDDLGDVDNYNLVESLKNEDEQHNYSDVDCATSYDDLGEDGNNWVSKVQMQELRSCFDNSCNIEIDDKISDRINEDTVQDSVVQIKCDPDEYQPVDSSIIKTEPGHDHEYMGESHNYSQINIITKQEEIVESQVRKELLCRQSSTSFDEQLFESFVNSNKMVANLNDYGTSNEEIFSQSSQRVRRQYEPDLDDEINVLTDTMNLLVPQHSEFRIQNSKDRLIESSQEEEEDDDLEENKKLDKKKPETRKGKLKKNSKENRIANKGKIIQKNDVTVLKKKMKDKIRQEKTQSESSDSESDCLKLNFKKSQEKSKDNKCYKDLEVKQKEDDEKVIQCNDVDSTEFIIENKSEFTKHNNKEDPDENHFENITDERSASPLVNSNEPVEILECEPTLPIFDELVKKGQTKEYINYISNATSYVDRYGWKCYPIERKDSKIYTHPYVQLHKLPESFTDTYFKYKDGTHKITEDLAIDKLTNLQSLQHTESKEIDNLSKTNPKIIKKRIKLPATSEVIESIENQLEKEYSDEFSPSEDESQPNVNGYISPTPIQSCENRLAKNLLMNNDNEEEKPNKDETDKDEIVQDEAARDKAFQDETTREKAFQDEAEKYKAVQDESDKDEVETKMIKTENIEEKTYKTRSGRTVKCKVEKSELWNDDLVLTADKMMNKELALLNAPVQLKEENEEEDSKNFIKKSHNKNQKNSSKNQTTRNRIKTEDDSSSEEEKQWFTTKEKLLKRLIKKNEDTKVDDAKRAKIVSEFIEKRGELPELRQRARVRKRYTKKAAMERRKQIKILSRELFGVDTVYTKKYSPASTSKGRRNIRKVIDKKSLARSTVVSNMEEFERKRRLTIRQAQLRESLGCEEGVNVVVINDELCLEYDFEEKRPVVSVHQFFTKVMKAHQYEGVKFMWDACFESVSLTGGGGPGGGCILAHCMGLGKTLQVLALLHTVRTPPLMYYLLTVLTHPEVAMRRVLVCCPLSTVLNWVDEIHKWIGPVTNTIKVFELSKLKKTYERAYQLEDWYNGGGIFIIGYELFRSLSTLDPVLDCVRPTIVNKIRTALLDPGPDIIVCDEGHLLKNDCSVLAVAMSRVATKRRIILTGTPMQNNLREYYCMVNFVKPNLLGSYSEYSNRFENPIMNGQHRDSREEDIKLMKARTHILHKVLEGCLQRQEASVLYPYLPKKYEYTVFIPLTKCQWDLYKHYLTHYTNTKANKQSVLRDFHVLQKIWTHPLVLNNFLMKTRDDEKEPKLKAEKLDEELEESPEQAAPSAAAWWARTRRPHALHQLHSSYKFLVVFRLLHECVALGDKVLIFSTSLYAMDALEFFLNRENKWTLGREYYRLDGSVPAEVRQKWCREFNAPQNTSTKLFLISTRAGSLGLNMTAANRVIILDTSWNPAHDIQSIFRVYRFGQKKDCYIYRLVAMGTMEQKIYERSVTKQAVACRVVDEQQIDRHYNMAELSELYRLDEAGAGVSAGLAAGVRDAALLRVAAAGDAGLHAVHEHDSLLRGSSETVLPEHERNAAWMQFQQEHATTHIRNFEINVPKQSSEDSHTVDNLTSEKENNTNTNAVGTSSKKIKKSKKKSNKINQEQHTQPSKSHQDLDPKIEEDMIKKIMHILIKHNFHTTKSPDEISALVMNVRDVVAKTDRNLTDVDPLTASIARVLLEGDNIIFPENRTKQTENTDKNKVVFDHDTDIMEMDLQLRKRRRNRIDSDDEYFPGTRKRKPPAKSHTRKSNECSDPKSMEVIANKENDNKKEFANKDDIEVISNKGNDSTEFVANEERTTEVIVNEEDSTGVIANEESSTKVIANDGDNTKVIANEENSTEIIANEGDNIIFPENKTKQTDKNKVAFDHDTDIMGMDLQFRKRRRTRIGSVDEYLPETRKRKPTAKTHTRKSNEPSEVIANKGNYNKKVIANEDDIEVISNKEKYSTEVSANEVSSTEIIANEGDSTEVIANEENRSEVIANEEDSIEIIANEEDSVEVIDSKEEESTEAIAVKVMTNKEPVLLITTKKKPEALSKISSESNHIKKIYEKKYKKGNVKDEIAKNVVSNEKRKNHVSVEKESTNQFVEVNDNCDIDKFTEKGPELPTLYESICLSDDDDDEPVITELPFRTELETAEAKQTVPETAEAKKTVVENMTKDDTIPLHKSVLTNKNFIKLVAHTYLSGNPMLDEDAALLAAQYSTLKALKEVQATGKDLTSGPIHEIAIKVLGKDLMKRLFAANPNKNTAQTMILESEDLENKIMKDMLLENSDQVQKQQSEVINKKPQPETKCTNKRKLGILRKAIENKEDHSKASQSTTQSSQGNLSSVATTTKVVPIGIFKGPVAASSLPLSPEECILPDDDEVIISAPAREPLARLNSRQLIVNAVSSKDSSGGDQSRVQKLKPIATVSVASRPLARVAADKASLPSEIENSNNNVPTVQNVSKSAIRAGRNIKKNTAPCHVTICLDSDEDDIPSIVPDKTLTKSSSSDSRTLIVSPLVENIGTYRNEVNDNEMVPVPVTTVNTIPPSTAEDVIKTRTVSVDPRKKLTKEENDKIATETKCKPGDIIRINEMGKVEILKRITCVEKAKQLQITQLKENNKSDDNVKPLKTQDKSAKKILVKPVLSKEDKLKDIPSTSKQQDDSSPMSVFKNVIHILADQFENAKAPKPPVENSLSAPSPSKEVTLNTKLPNPKLLEVKPVITSKNIQQIKNKNDLTKSISGIKTGVLPKPGGDVNKDIVIDLTSYQQVQVKKARVPAQKVEVFAITNSSKEIVTNKVSSAIIDPKKTIITIRNKMAKSIPKPSTSNVVPAMSESKRPSPWGEGASSKKIKTDFQKKMTLKDFNLDDFDDIIELE